MYVGIRCLTSEFYGHVVCGRLATFQFVEGPSGAAEAASPGPQVISHPLGSPRVEVVSSSLGGATPTDSKILKVLMVMQSCYNSDSTMMVRRLAKVRERLCIPVEYELHVPMPGQHAPVTSSRTASGC
ncbi:hypothetical protein GW17_00029473 [Ensete ventricosum]|nr:hypothetical protein GW17_00029473 [Ensete ventricosum]